MCNNGNGNCISNILEKILMLQQREINTPQGCNRPMLGNTLVQVNTRPINLYCCCTNAMWNMPYNFNGTEGTSNIFRIESLNENTATFRILIPSENGYTATDNYFTINLNYVSCIKCLEDQLITNI